MTLFKSTSRNGVIALNVLLIAVLTAIVFVPTSNAQPTGSFSPAMANAYLAVPSVASGMSTGVVYIVSTNQREMVAVAWNQNRNKIMTLGYRNIAADAQSVPLN
jgi:uncharacterized lipoprotein YajG